MHPLTASDTEDINKLSQLHEMENVYAPALFDFYHSLS